MKKNNLTGREICWHILLIFSVLILRTLPSYGAPPSPATCTAGSRNDSVKDVAAVCNQVIIEAAPANKDTCQKLIEDGASRAAVDGSLAPYSTLGADQQKLRSDTEICIKMKVRGDQASKARLLSEVSDPSKAGRFFAFLESPAVFPGLICYHPYSRAQVICDTLKTLVSEKDGGLGTVIAEMDSFYARPKTAPAPATPKAVASKPDVGSKPVAATPKPSTPASPSVQQGKLGAAIADTVKDDIVERNSGVQAVNVTMATDADRIPNLKPSDKVSVEVHKIPVSGGSAVASIGSGTPGKAKQNDAPTTDPNVVRADNDGNRGPASTGATVVAGSGAPPASSTAAARPTTPTRTTPAPKLSSTSDANNYVTRSPRDELPVRLDTAMSTYRTAAKTESNVSRSFQNSLIGGDYNQAMSNLRAAAISSNTISLKPTKAPTYSSSSPRANYSLEQNFNFMQSSRPSSALLPQPLVQVERQTSQSVYASAVKQDNLVNDIRSAVYKPSPSNREPKFDPNARVQVDSRFIAQTASLSSAEVADVAGRLFGIPSEKLQEAVAAAQDENMKSAETASGNPEDEAKRKEQIIRSRTGLNEAQAKVLLPLIGGFSSEAKNFIREQRVYTAGVLDENQKAELTNPSALEEHNRNQLRELNDNRKPVAVVDADVARQIARDANFHPVVGTIENNPRHREEMAAQGRVNYMVESLLAKGYKQESIKQVWMVGPIKRGETSIVDKYNTTAAVKTKSGWLALDSLEGHAVPLEEWVNRRSELSQNQMATLYIKEPKRAPQELSEYDRAHLGVNVARSGSRQGQQKIGDYFEAINKYILKTAGSPEM